MDGQRVLAARSEPMQRGHQERLAPLVRELGEAAGVAFRDIERIGATVGPGSFTGLRVGITVAKTLAFATGARIAAVPTLHVLARNAPPEAKNVLVVLDAKRGHVFTARLRRSDDPSGGWAEDEPAHLDTLADILARSPRPVYLIGEGIPFHEQFLPAGDAGVIVTPPERWKARAGDLAAWGSSMMTQGEVTEPDRLLPVYIRRPEAGEESEQKVWRR